MNPIAAAAIGSIIRWALAFVAGYLVEHGIWSPGDATSYVAAASLGILALAWSLWQKYKNRITFLTALQSPAGTSEAAVQSKIETGMGAKLLPMILLVLALGAGSLGATSCAKAPPTLSPAGQTAFNALRVGHALDLIRDTANDAAHQNPPLITRATLLKIVDWHEAAVKTIVAVPGGWKPTVLASLDALQQAIPAAEWSKIALYVALLKTVIAEIP